MLILNSNHTYEHILSELEIYSKFVTKDGFLLVLDTVIDDLKSDPRPWGLGSSPESAVKKFMSKNPKEVTRKKSYAQKTVLSVAHYGC